MEAKTYLTKDNLVIDGWTLTVDNVIEANNFVDIPSTCQQGSPETLLFFGMHSVFSNLHPVNFKVNNVTYSSVEQMLQSEKAAVFNDDIMSQR